MLIEFYRVLLIPSINLVDINIPVSELVVDSVQLVHLDVDHPHHLLNVGLAPPVAHLAPSQTTLRGFTLNRINY